MTEPQVAHYGPVIDNFKKDLLRGLGQAQKQIPCKYFYDEAGSRLFDRICELEEYYPTRTEVGILDRNVQEIADEIGPNCLLIEYGSGSSIKTRILLDALPEPVAYVPIDISGEHLAASAKKLAARYPRLQILPVCADYTGDYRLPRPRREPARCVVFFPGSTIGNFTAPEAVEFLHHVVEVCGPRGGLLIGVDLKKDRAILKRAYDDSEGVTAAFNLNLLARANRELGADFVLDQFRHRAHYAEAAGRVEIHLESLQDQQVRIDDQIITFAAGELIHTENSHKYSLDQFAGMAEQAGLQVNKVWVDEQRLFSMQFLSVV